MSRTTCSCPNKKCFQGICDCLIRNAVCCSGCNCGGDCQNDLSLGTINPAAAQGTTPTLASGSSANQSAAAQAAADQSAAAQAAAQPQPKPLPAQEPESKGEARNTSPSAVKMKFIDQGCSCRTIGCNHHRCPCFTRNVRCTSNCKCPATICVNPVGAKGDESNTQPGGQQGTSGTPDEAVLEQESQIVQPRDTLSLVSTMSERTCGCTNSDCFQSCVCYTTNVICSPDCKCHGHCLHNVVKRWSAAQAAAQTLPSSSVVAALVPDTKTKALPA
ncbi:hypothetical protein CFC21_004417 [Triticum aestivum]|uniref:CRC domain-containing protein n=1 Tax=Triticum aestivum TaxID=4565 RepID=A0A3B5Y743_WHEAT|nr:protein tesmin/TSO1-like CXC 6 [Triticum aestivum]KAF6986693.1 hypothetical protein CFC21_004417 [Triticum aestivum]